MWPIDAGQTMMAYYVWLKLYSSAQKLKWDILLDKDQKLKNSILSQPSK